VGAGDRERFSWMVEKSAELGVTRVVPLDTARTTGVATRVKQSHLDRLRRASLQAIKQSGVSWAPTVESPIALEQFAAEPLRGAGWLADQGGDPVPTWLDQHGVTVIVGPEGGLTDAEREMVVHHGFRPVALATHTLRFETAAVAAAAAITQARMRRDHG
jgi:16S rRNA (uracil1498-N3)-methyltransferase